MGYVYRPSTVDQLGQLLVLAAQENRPIGLRGGGNSYGDAACNSEGIVLELTRLNRILAWNPLTGIITVEPGVRLRQLWEYVLADGWWPPVCTGTQEITIGGGAAMNVHGKNAYRVGPIGNTILSFEMMLPDGSLIQASREENEDLFHAAIGGLGVLGCFTQLTLQMKRVYSGLLDVWTHNSGSLAEMFEQFKQFQQSADYLVGWVDTTATGAGLGRGELHRANYLAQGDDRYPSQTLQQRHQHLDDTLFGLFPRSAMWRVMQPFFNPYGVPFINSGKFWSSKWKDGAYYRQPHAQFHFLLNYFPNWQKGVGSGGLIQYQPFAPDETALPLFAELLRLSQRRGMAPYLGVIKRHKADPFWLTHGLEGWSFALDYRLTPSNRAEMVKLGQEMDALVLQANGRFYAAKDSLLRPEVARTYLGAETIAQFRALKARVDPQDRLQTDLWRRVFEA